jgi:hypothetical protein
VSPLELVDLHSVIAWLLCVVHKPGVPPKAAQTDTAGLPSLSRTRLSRADTPEVSESVWIHRLGSSAPAKKLATLRRSSFGGRDVGPVLSSAAPQRGTCPIKHNECFG